MANFICKTDIIILVTIALILLVLDRIYRINTIKSIYENGIDMPKQCGIGLPPCKFGTKCGNGYCIDNNSPELKPTMLPVFP
jgi:hypothetical protein